MQVYKNYKEKLALIKNGSLSLQENIAWFLEKIEKSGDLNAFNFVFSEDALRQGQKIQEKISSGNHGRLAGMVIAVKDVLAIKNKPLTCSSKILSNFTSLYDSTAVKRLLDEDAIIIGKTNCDEFAMGSSNENSAFGPVRNPNDRNRVAGGSSGGSAVAVAAGLCDASLGTDTGGSIRQPASFCGVFGLKPTYGRVSRYGLTAFASSFDSIGPFTSNIDDMALIMEVISGRDSFDSTSSVQSVPSFGSILNEENLQLLPSSIRIGIAKEYFGEGLNSEVRENIEAIINRLKDAGFKISEVSLPMSDYSIAAYYILTTAEASSNLARFDGARYGYRSNESSTLQDMYKNSRTEGFGQEVKRRIMLGTYVLSSGYYDAYYRKAQKVRRLIKQDFDNAFSQVDVILTPASPTTAFQIGEKSSDPLEMYLSDIYTTSANLAGIPGISIPVSHSSKGLPVGLQLMAKEFNEEALLSLGYYLQEKLPIKTLPE